MGQLREIENLAKTSLDVEPSHGTVQGREDSLSLPALEQHKTVTNVRGKTRMVRSRLGLKALGLCVLVLGLMAIAASGAQAEAGAKWLILNSAKTSKTFLKAKVQIKEILPNPTHGNEKVGVLKSEIGGTEVKFVATGANLIGVNLETEGKLTTGGKVEFTGVTTELKGKLSGPCKPLGTLNNDTTLGVITSNGGKGELVLHTGGVGVTKIQPETGITFGNLFFGEECSLPEEVPVITAVKLTVEGKEVLDVGNGLVIKDPSGIGNLNINHEITELSGLTELYTISVTPEHKAVVEGSATVRLIETHLGLEWNGTPG